MAKVLAGIEYAGLPGISRDCQDAVLRLLQFGDRITHVSILTSPNHHCLLIEVRDRDLVAIKSGFASGYGGEGPRRFSYVLQVLDMHNILIDEYEVKEAVISRLDDSALLASDITEIKNSRRITGSQWRDYIFEQHWEDLKNGELWQKEFPSVIPYSIIEPRLVDLALSFWNDPDAKLLTAYRRLEDIVREKTELKEHGQKLFSKAFQGKTPKLKWKDIDEGERDGRVALFTGTYMAYRNQRAHKETKTKYDSSHLTEFLLLNHLYILESEAVMMAV
jgi:hypothetical protein